MASKPGVHQTQPSVSSSTAGSPVSAAAPTPAASTTTASGSIAPPVVPNKPQRILACVLCQHRKIKCDRTFPCANCLKVSM